VFLIDGSSSMGPNGAWAIAGRELLPSLRRLASGTRVQVLVYNSRVTPLLPRHSTWLPVNAQTLDDIARAIDDFAPAGATDHGRALREALNLQPDVLYFLTDADDLTSEHLRIAAAHNRAGTIIHVIELNTANCDRPDMPLQALARAHRGTYRAIAL